MSEMSDVPTMRVLYFAIACFLFSMFIVCYRHEVRVDTANRAQQIAEFNKVTSTSNNVTPYTCYIDGKEVKPESVDLDDYHWTIDDAKKAVYLKKNLFT